MIVIVISESRYKVKIPKIGTWEAKMGFGYDDSSNTYKVVAAVQYSSMQLKTEPRVYCMGDNCWRNVASWTSFPRIVQGRGWILGGTLNWVGRLYTTHQNAIFSFDIRKETYRYLSLPVDVDIPFGDLLEVEKQFSDCL